MNAVPDTERSLVPEIVASTPPPGLDFTPFRLLATLDGGLPRHHGAHKAFARAAKTLNASASALALAANEVRNNEQRQSLVASVLSMNVAAGLAKTGADLTRT